MTHFTEIHFAHANGFPAATYRKLFSYLSDVYPVSYIDLLAHDPAYPVSDNWTHLTQQLIDHIKKHYRYPVIGVGHSLGGGLTYLAAIQQPELFKAIVLLDYPLFGKFKSQILAWSKKLGLIDYLTPAASTRHRRSTWPDKESAWKYLRKHQLFSHFDEICLQDYINYGMQRTAAGVQLKFSPFIEYRIFQTFPHHLPKISLYSPVPTAVIYGKSSKVLTGYDRYIIQKHYNFPLYGVSGTHLFPFEYPEAAANATLAAIKDLLARRREMSL